MDAKTYLEQAYLIETQINCKLQHVLTLRELATKATSIISATGTPVKGSRDVQSMQDVINKMVDLQEEINNDIDTMVDLKNDILSIIDKIEKPEYRMILEMRYLCYMSWREITADLRRASRWVYRLHEYALEAFDEKRKQHMREEDDF